MQSKRIIRQPEPISSDNFDILMEVVMRMMEQRVLDEQISERRANLVRELEIKVPNYVTQRDYEEYLDARIKEIKEGGMKHDT